MPGDLFFVTGGSSGIGLALVRAVPLSPVRIVDISRRGAHGCVHHAADLADPRSWLGVAELFEREIAGFDGGRVVFVHSAGTLTPMGFAGEVDDAEYTRNVLLNSAAPQVLCHAFLRAMRRSSARGQLVIIGSGAAESVYAGWTAYGAGKAAVNQWVRIAGAEQALRGNRCRILAIAPGVVATAMQAEIREMDRKAFPDVDRFIELYESGDLRDPDVVAREIWDAVLGDSANGAVLDLRALAD